MGMPAMPSQTITTVGSRIIEARKAKDMTQLDLAKRLGISRAAVEQWEIDSTSPSIAKLEEVAMILGVEPQWLAYNVKQGEARIVYRNPERDNIAWLNEYKFGDSPEDLQVGDKWGIPAEYITREIGASVEGACICTINSHAVEPEFEYGDKVIVDKIDTKPSPGGVFLYWDGIGFAYARMQAIPGAVAKVRISQKGSDTFEMVLSEVTIIGRVKARFQRN